MPGSFKNGINLGRMPCKYWDNVTKISYLQRVLIVHSIIYYELNGNCIPDAVYDAISKQLVHLQSSVTQSELERSQYYYAMYDFDGSTGFDIFGRLIEKDKQRLMSIARNILFGNPKIKSEKRSK